MSIKTMYIGCDETRGGASPTKSYTTYRKVAVISRRAGSAHEHAHTRVSGNRRRRVPFDNTEVLGHERVQPVVRNAMWDEVAFLSYHVSTTCYGRSFGDR